MRLNKKELIHELKHHSPFTLLATLIGIILVLLLKQLNILFAESFFEFLHPAHLFVSSIVTTAIFYKYKQNKIQAILVGVMGSIVIGSLSDIIFPWIGGNLLNLNTSFHLPLIEKPFLILMTALIGSTTGLITKTTKMPHFIHVFVSVFASLFYLLAFSESFNLIYFLGAFIVVFIAVIIPCCISDIVFPFFFLGEKIKHCECKN